MINSRVRVKSLLGRRSCTYYHILVILTQQWELKLDGCSTNLWSCGWLTRPFFWGGVTLWPPASHNATWHHCAIDFDIWDGKSYGYSNSASDYIYGVKMCIICDILSRNRPHQIISVPWSDPRECCDRDRCGWLQIYMPLRLLLLIQLLVCLHLSILSFGQGRNNAGIDCLNPEVWLLNTLWAKVTCWKVLTGNYLESVDDRFCVSKSKWNW